MAQSIRYQIKIDFEGFEPAGNIQLTRNSGLLKYG